MEGGACVEVCGGDVCWVCGCVLVCICVCVDLQ